jgi:hypothetical protein
MKELEVKEEEIIRQAEAELAKVVGVAEHHKVLTLAYLAAAIIGIMQTIGTLRALNTGQAGNPFIYLLLVEMIGLALAGWLGYYWHAKKKPFNERFVIIPIIMGVATISLSSLFTSLIAPPKDPFLVDFSGFMTALSLWLMLEFVERITNIKKKRKQITVSIEARKIADQKTDPKSLAQEAVKIRKLIEE